MKTSAISEIGIMVINSTTSDVLWSSRNDSRMPDEITEFAYIMMVFLPAVGIFGLFGNILAIWVFLDTSMKRSSFTIYLTARSLSDTGFLVSMIIVWLDAIEIRWFHSEGICQITVCLSYVSSFLSVWFVTYAALENYIRMCCPYKVSQYCHPQTAKLITLATFIVSITLYNFPLWSTTVYVIGGKKYCQPKQKFNYFHLIVVYCDAVSTLLFPFLVIVISTSLVICSALKGYKRRLRMRRKTKIAKAGHKQTAPQIKVSQFLLGISLSFLILHTPSHVVRLRIMIMSIVKGISEQERFDESDRYLKIITEMMYYSNFCLNCLIYLACGEKFRKCLHAKLFGIFVKNPKTIQSMHIDRYKNDTDEKTSKTDT